MVKSFFFDKLINKFESNILKSNKNYNSFNYISTGNIRFDGEIFRFKNIEEDFVEASRGLKL